MFFMWLIVFFKTFCVQLTQCILSISCKFLCFLFLLTFPDLWKFISHLQVIYQQPEC